MDETRRAPEYEQPQRREDETPATVKTRQAVTGHGVRYVLYGGVILVVTGFIAVYFAMG